MNGIRSLLLVLTSALVLTGCSGKPSHRSPKVFSNKCTGSHRLFGKTFGDRCEEDTRIEDSVTVKGLDQVDRVSEDKRGNEEGADDRGEILRDGLHV